MSSSQSDNLTQNGDLATRGTYFSSPELSQRADLLRHLTENSNLIPLIRGAEGMGKTTFIQNLLDLAPENWIPVKISADVMLQPDALLAYMAGLFDQDDRSERLFDGLISYFEDLRHDGFLPVIIVDDAHLLPEASVITLLRLHERGADERPLVQILLFAEPEIDELLKTPQLRVMNLHSLQLLDMPEFTLKQTGLFLEHLLSSVDALSIDPLTASQIEEIHAETGGSPGLIKEHATSLIESTSKVAKTEKQPSSSPSITMIGGGAVIVIVLLILLYQDSINSIFSGDDDAVSTAQTEPHESEGYKPLAIPESYQAITSEQNEDEQVTQALPEYGDTGEGEATDLGPVAAEESADSAVQMEVADTGPQDKPTEQESSPEQTEPAVTTSISAEESVQPEEDVSIVKAPAGSEERDIPIAVKREKDVAQKLDSAEDQLVKQADSKEQIEQEVPEEKKVAQPIAAEQTTDQPKVVQKQPTDRVEINKKAIAPQDAPAVKSVASDVKKQLKSVEANKAAAQDGAKNFPAPVEDRSTALVKKEPATVKAVIKPATTAPKPAGSTPNKATNNLLREQWLLRQKPTSYTIQLVGLQDEKGIAKFIQRHSLTGPIAYYRTQRNGKAWYPVLYGVYSSRSGAVAARNNLPEAIVNSGPWLRTLNAVQKDIRAR